MICPVRGKLGIMCPSAEKLCKKMTGNLPITLTSLVPAILRKCQFLFCVCVFGGDDGYHLWNPYSLMSKI